MKTDTELKMALAKMLPTEIKNVDGILFWANMNQRYGGAVLDTELLHVCWLVEERFSKDDKVRLYWNIADQTGIDEYITIPFVICHATWQQRATALCKVKGIEV